MAVSEDDPRPAYVQVADDLERAISAGKYRAGQRVPTGRALAEQYEVNRNTVVRAVDILKARGVVESHSSRGVFVRSDNGGGDPSGSPEYNEIMRQLNAVQARLDSFEQRLNQVEEAADLAQPAPADPRND